MFCKQCGTACDDGAKFCKGCGAPLQADSQAPVAAPVAAPAAAPASLNVNGIVDAVKKYMAIIIVVIAALALILSIMNLFNTYDVTATAKAGGEKMSNSVPIKDVFESEETDGAFTLALIGNIFFGVANLAIAAVGVLYFLQKTNNIDIYNKYVTTYIKRENPLFMMGVIGAASALIQIITYALCKYEQSYWTATITTTIANHWTTWVALFVYALLAVADKFLLSKKN